MSTAPMLSPPGVDAAASPLEALVERRRGGAPRGSHRARALAEELGSPHRAVPAIHVAGTNGKTSVVRMISSLFTALGMRVGDTTSPHLHHLGERIRIDGVPADDATLGRASADLADAIERAEQRVGEPVTFFDAVTAVALRTFVQAGCDLAVVEAGIGGAGDATEIVDGRVAVLTPIGLDHAELGQSHAEVATNKAAIVPRGGAVVSAVQQVAAAQVVAQVAADRGADLLRAGHEVRVLGRRVVDGGQHLELQGLGGFRLGTVLPLLGAAQADNAALALGAVQAALGTDDLDAERLRAGFAAVRVPGRVELRRLAVDGPLVVLDGAHDPEAARAMATTVRERVGDRPVAVVVGASGGRDPAPMLAPLQTRFGGAGITALTAAADVPGASSPRQLADRLRSHGWEADPTATVSEALGAAARRVGPDGVVIVMGSMYLVAAARAFLLDQELRSVAAG